VKIQRGELEKGQNLVDSITVRGKTLSKVETVGGNIR